MSGADSKKILRNKLLDKRKYFNEDMHRDANEAIFKNIIALISKSFELNEIGLYWPLKGEPDLLKIALAVKNPIGLPKIIKSEMSFVKYDPMGFMERSSLPDLYHPKSSIEILPKLIIIPALGLSVSGYRIGFGYGYYDKYLAKINQIYKTIAVGVCFYEDLFEYIEHEIHDYQVNYVITDKIIIKV